MLLDFQKFVQLANQLEDEDAELELESAHIQLDREESEDDEEDSVEDKQKKGKEMKKGRKSKQVYDIIGEKPPEQLTENCKYLDKC
jgi:hypothetical protein